MCKYGPIYNIVGKSCFYFWGGVIFIWFHRIIENWAERAWRDHLYLPCSVLNKETKWRFYMHVFPEIWTLPLSCVSKASHKLEQSSRPKEGGLWGYLWFLRALLMLGLAREAQHKSIKIFALLYHCFDGHLPKKRKKLNLWTNWVSMGTFSQYKTLKGS